jgi:polyhydroxyalkanoate synthase
MARASTTLSAELVRILLGRSGLRPERGDWRFKDPTWNDNPVYRRLAQTYLASCGAADTMLEEIERSGGRQRSARARFAVDIFTSAASPTNTLLGNPGALKRTFESGGGNLVRGIQHFVSDLRHNGGMPSMAKPGALKVGEDLALTPGKVVDKDEFAELLQYAPSTEEVHERPTIVVPPPIGRYYFLDLRPGRSFVEYAVSRGLQTFLISWRNPSKDEAEWNIDTYAQRILDAVDSVREITGAENVNVIGFCAGGILQTVVLNKLASMGDDRIHSVSYAVTLLDFGQSAPIGAFSSARLLSLARWNSGRAGVISARAMGAAFTWMRPNDLVWNYWVNNYLMGEDPPVFDILSWNADGTNLPAALHRQFLDIFEHNPIPTPPAASRRSENRSTLAQSGCRLMSPARSTTTSRRGSRPTGRLSSLPATPRSCCRTPGTSPAWSTRPATPRPATTQARTTRTSPRRIGSRVPRSRPAPGGSTGATGWKTSPAT